MTRNDIASVVLEELANIAPEVDTSTIHGSMRLREVLDIDSMDFLNFIVALHHRLKVEIPEADYPHLATLDDAVTYLAART